MAGENETLTQEQLHQAVEKARLEERAKLRQELDTVATRAATLEETLKAEQAAKTELATRVSALEAGVTKTATGEPVVDIAKVVEQATSAVATRLNSDHAKTLTEMQTQLSALREESNRNRLAATRERLIAEAGGINALIPELVVGSTEDELKAAVTRSKSIFDRTVLQTGSAGAASLGTGNAGSSGGDGLNLPVGQAGGAGGNANGAATVQVNARAMSMAEYASKREALKREAAARYKGQPAMG